MKEDDLPFDLAKTIACMRAAGTDLQSCEVKSAVGKLPKDLAESVSAFSNGSGGTIVLGLSEEEGFKPALDSTPSARKTLWPKRVPPSLHPPSDRI